nr:hypothetical protein [Candidatus Liberibacter africanus]
MIKKDSVIRYFLVNIATAVLLNSIFPSQYIAGMNNLPYYTLIDSNTGHVIAENYPDHPWNPASLTKLMTAYVIFSFLEGKKSLWKHP